MRTILLCLLLTLSIFTPRAQNLPPATNPVSGISTGAPPARPAPPARFQFKDGDRIVFLGDTWMEREQKDGYIETLLTSRLQGKKAIFRNLAWSADTVLGRSRASFDPPEKGFDRLKEQLEAIKPTVAFLGYGMAESFNGQAGLAKFKRDINTLMDTITNISNPEPVRFVIVTPLYQERPTPTLPDPTEHNAQLELYATALREIATNRNSAVVDLFGMTRDYHKRPGVLNLTDNGIHPTAAGYWRIASLFERGLNLFVGVPRMGIGINNSVRPGGGGVKPSNISRTENTIRLTGEDEFVFSPPEPKRWGVTNSQYGFLIQFIPLPPGNYTLKIDGEISAVYSDKDWTRAAVVRNGPLYDRVEEMRHAIIKKNELFFYRWRPQNQTYLFGFRKYEQGRNAKEIPMFDPLISAEEEKIFRLAELKKRQFELAPAQPGDEQKIRPPGEKATPSAEVHHTPLPEPTFDLGANLDVTLWAENPLLAKPIQMNFDAKGRLWVASSSVYPQIQPGQEANDKILILEDTNEDGKADKTTVFADGLLIPTGVLPGDGGAYVANSTELLFYKDYDADGQADEKRIMLSGFGTEDTHHILHTLRWGFDGQLYMNQSIYIHSHIETPNGVVRLNSGGTLNLRPNTQELGIHMKGLVNSWGHHFDRFGQSFVTDGAGGEGINWVIPQAMFVTYEGARRVLHSVSPGSYPKFCSLEMIESEAFPEDWQGTLVTCDFRAHRVVRFAINEQGAGYVTTELPDVMRSTNVTFRPIDVKLGPDGALYIADWSNPIIQHGEVDFRDPRRDHEHGRIWRLKYKDRPLLKKAELVSASNSELFNNLLSPNLYVREQSRRVLTERGLKIKEDLDRWTKNQDGEQAQLEALWMYQSIDSPEAGLLRKLLEGKDGRIRAAAVRVLSFWWKRIVDPIGLLAGRVQDEHPRVRVEAVRAAAKIPSARSAELVLSALDKPLDRFSDYAIWLSINDLAEPWVKAIQSGEWKWEGREKQLEFGLKAIEPAQAGAVLAKVLAEKPIDKQGTGPWIDLVAAAGSREQLGVLLEQVVSGYFIDTARVQALKALSEAARLRQLSPDKGRENITVLFDHQNVELRAAAVRLAGDWKLQQFTGDLLKLAGRKETPGPVRNAAFVSLREIGRPARDGLADLAANAGGDPIIRAQATSALTAVDLAKGIPTAIELLDTFRNQSESAALEFWRALLANKGAAPALAQALPKSGLPPTVVKAGLRVAREGGRNEPNLVLALARNIDAEDETKNLSPEELNRLLASVREKGDPARGEMIYRRQELGCVTCHSIGGVGGKVGPDLTSIGASAPMDYLIESVQFPNRKVKEGFHSLMIETKDDQEVAGILVRESTEQIVLRDASNREISVAKNNVNKRSIGGSIMPAGLIDALNAQDQADLYRFLSELGKPGRYDASKGNVARTWKIMPRTLDVAQFTDDKVVMMESTGTIEHNNWQPINTQVDGRLTRNELQEAIRRVRFRDPDALYAKTTFEVAKSGRVHLRLPQLEKAAVWIDGKPLEAKQEIEVELSSGQHILAVKLDAKALPEFLTASTNEGTFINN